MEEEEKIIFVHRVRPALFGHVCDGASVVTKMLEMLLRRFHSAWRSTVGRNRTYDSCTSAVMLPSVTVTSSVI